MGILDQAKDLLDKGVEKSKGFAEDHADQLKTGIEKVEGLADKATRGKWTDKIVSAGEKLEGKLPTKDGPADDSTEE